MQGEKERLLMGGWQESLNLIERKELTKKGITKRQLGAHGDNRGPSVKNAWPIFKKGY